MKALIVDDSELILDVLEAQLRALGSREVARATDAAAALARLDPDLDLVVVDVMLPGRSGIDLVRDIRARTGPERPLILVISGIQETWPVQAAIEAGADDFLSKPVAADKLARSLRFFGLP